MRALLPISALLVAVAILLTGNGLLGILLPIRGALDGFSIPAIAAIGSFYFAGFAAGCLFGARLVRAVGHIRCFTAMTAIVAAVALLHSFVVFPPVWWLLRGGTGFCFAVLYMVIESWLNERATPETRSFVLSAYMIITMTVLTLGQMLLPLFDPRGMQLFALVSILVSVAAVPVALTGATAPAPIGAVHVDPRRLWRRSPAGAATCFAVGLAIGPFWALTPQFCAASGLDQTGVALFMSAAVLGGAVGQWPLGRLSDFGDRRRVILLSAAIGGAIGIVISVQLFESTGALCALAAAWGALAFPMYSLGVAHANDHAEPGDFVETAAGLLLLYAGGAIAGPLLATLVMQLTSPTMLFVHSATIHVLLFGYVAWRAGRGAPVPDAQHTEFVQSLQAASTVSPVFDEITQRELEQAAHDDTANPH